MFQKGREGGREGRPREGREGKERLGGKKVHSEGKGREEGEKEEKERIEKKDGREAGRDLQRHPPYFKDKRLNLEASVNHLNVNNKENHLLCFISKNLKLKMYEEMLTSALF